MPLGALTLWTEWRTARGFRLSLLAFGAASELIQERGGLAGGMGKSGPAIVPLANVSELVWVVWVFSCRR